MPYKKLWIALGMVLTVSFAVLGGVGVKVLRSAPPIPSQVVTADGRVVFDGATIQDGQGVWQSIGGQEVGAIWGHGSYVAPDWTADWLHRESMFLLDRWAAQTGAEFLHSGHLNDLRWMRMIGDTIFAVGAGKAPAELK